MTVCILSPCLFNFYAEYIIRKSGLEEAQAGIKIGGRNIKNLRYADDTTLMAESEEAHRLLARILEWVAFPFSRGSSQSRDRTQVSRIAGRHFTIWATL